MTQPTLTHAEIRALWREHKDAPKDHVIEYTTRRGEAVQILVGYLRYLVEYISEEEE